MTVADPAQPLIGGLAVAIIVANGSDAGRVRAMKDSFEELGANVLVVADRRGPFAQGAAGSGIDAQQRIPLVDPDALDAAIVVGDGDGGSQLVHRADLEVFLERMAAEGKPLGGVAIDEPPVQGMQLLGDGEELEDLVSSIKHQLADRRRATLSIDNELPSAVGEDG